jgi:hypothetical protein
MGTHAGETSIKQAGEKRRELNSQTTSSWISRCVRRLWAKGKHAKFGNGPERNARSPRLFPDSDNHPDATISVSAHLHPRPHADPSASAFFVLIPRPAP